MGPTFSVGNIVVLPGHGVAEITGIEQEISGQVGPYYVLRLAGRNERAMVPVHRAKEVGLREIIKPGEIRKVLDVLEQRDIRVTRQTWNQRYRAYLDKIKSGSLFEVAEVYRDLNRLKSTKTLSFGESRMLEVVKGLIESELAAARRLMEVSPPATSRRPKELLYSLFPDLDIPQGTANIVLVQEYATRLFYAVNDICSLERLSPRELEELLAETFRQEGFEAHLTPQTRDGGRDVIAFRPGVLPFLVVAEAKKKRLVERIIRNIAGLSIQFGNPKKMEFAVSDTPHDRSKRF